MPIYKNKRQEAANLHYKHELINNNLLELYYKITKNHTSQNTKKEKIDGLIRNHKKFINILDIHSKKKHTSLYILEHYNNTTDKDIAFSTLTCALNNRGLFSKS